MGNLIKLTSPGLGTKGDTARREIEKLARMHDYLSVELERIDSRSQALDDPGRPPPSPEERAAVERELKSIERQVKEHLKNVESFEKGAGFIAAADPRLSIQTALAAQGLAAQAPGLITAAQAAGKLDELGDLADLGVLGQLTSSGIPLDRVVPILVAKGFKDTIRLDNDLGYLVAHLGQETAPEMVGKAFKPNLTKSLSRIADMAGRMRTLPRSLEAPDPAEAGKDLIILDSNVLIPHETAPAAGAAISDINAAAYLGMLTNADIRVPLAVHTETRIVPGKERKGVPLEPGMNRDHPDYVAVLRALDHADIGRSAKGAGDRSVVADALFAQTGVDAATGLRQPAILVTADVDVYNRLARMNPATKPTNVNNRWTVPGSPTSYASEAEAVSKVYGPNGTNGFDVTITIAPGRIRVVHVVPIEGS